MLRLTRHPLRDPDPPGDRPRLGYQPTFDGLRAVAVLLVVAYHYAGWPHGVGFGVDLFFVLSGFLITTILLEERRAYGTIRLGRFYARRALRLFPALWVLLAAYVVVVPLTGATLRPVLVRALEGFTYTVNIVLATGHNPGSYLEHLWSLGVEEQFYLIWPLALVLLLGWRLRLGRGLTFAVAVALAIVGIRLAVARSSTPDGPAVWATRFDPILVGCALALGRASRFGSRLTHIAAANGTTFGAIGIAALLVIVAGNNSISDGEGFAFALSCAVLILGGTGGHSVVRAALNRLLSIPLATFLGRISYALYLWHRPVLVFFLNASFYASMGHLPARVAALTISLVAAIGSYYCVERPFLRLKWKLARTSSHDVDIPIPIGHGSLAADRPRSPESEPAQP